MVDHVKVAPVTEVLGCLDEDEHGVAYEYQRQDRTLFVKVSWIHDKKRLMVGVETPGSYAGDIVRDPVEHAENVGHSDAAEELRTLFEAFAARGDVEDIRGSGFTLDGVHGRYHDVRRTYFEYDLREPLDI